MTAINPTSFMPKFKTKQNVEAARKAYDEQYSEIMGLSYDDALSSLRGKQSTYRVSDGQRGD